MSRRRRSKGGARFVALYHWLLNSAAWRDLDAVSRCLYVELASRYMGQNNGRIPYSVREGAAELRVSKATVSRALQCLVDHGFIKPTMKGHFDFKKRHATEWRLTQYDYEGQIATKDFMRWSPPAGSLATAPCGGALASRAVPFGRVPPGRLEASLS